MQPFHLAIPVHDLPAARHFYHEVLGCPLGRTDPKWIDFNFFGHQLSVHLKPEECHLAETNAVDGEQVPVRHFGLVLEWSEWEKLAERIRGLNALFLIAPTIRFAGKVGEQGTFFMRDPSGNALEFKTFKDIGSQLFATD